MITLEDGDYFDYGTTEQYKELCELESWPLAWERIDNGIVFNGFTFLIRIPNSPLWAGTKPHTFEEFKQKAINTFKS